MTLLFKGGQGVSLVMPGQTGLSWHLEDFAFFHDENNFLHASNFLDRIAINGDDIGQFVFFERSQSIVNFE